MVAWNWMLTAEMGRSGHIHNSTIYVRAGFPGGQMVKNLPSVWETWVRSLDWEDPLEEDMATHSSILAKRMPTDRGAWQTPWGCKDLDTTEQLSILGYEFETFLLELLLLYPADFGLFCFHFLCLHVFFHFFFSFFKGSLIISNILFRK